MKRNSTLKTLCLTTLLVVAGQFSFAQTGAAGVGSSSTNVMWLDVHALGYPNGFGVTNAADMSGNGNDFVQNDATKRPTINSTAINGLPALSFDGVDDYMDASANAGLNSANLTYFIVYQKANLKKQCFLSANYASQVYKWSSYANHNVNTIWNAQYSPTINHVSFMDANTFSFLSVHITPTQMRVYKQGVLMMTKTATYSAPTGHQLTRLGLNSNATNNLYCLQGHIAEVVVYNTALNNLERILVENYLGAKYNLAIPTDHYDFQATHNIGLVGIGDNGVDSHTNSIGSGVLSISSPASMTSGEYLLAAHTNTSLSSYVSAGPPSIPTHQRWSRTWRIDETGDVGTLNIAFDLSGGLGFGTASSYRLLVDADGDFSDATVITGTYDGGTQIASFSADLTNGDYITLAGENVALQIHSITSGNWSDPNTWDCTCVPGNLDEVFIEPATTVTVDVTAEAGYITVVSGGILEMTAANDLLIYGDLLIVGSANFTDGQISFVGSVDQYVDANTNTVQFNDIYIDNATAPVTFLSGEYLLNGTLSPVNGELIVDASSTFIVNSTGAANSGRIGETVGVFTFTGNFIVRRFIPAGVADYRDISSPVSGADLSMWDASIYMSGEGFPDGCAYGTGGCFYSVKRFNNYAYNDITNPNLPLTPTLGYEVYMGDDTVTFSGVTLSVTGTIEAGSISSPAIGTGWSIQGNPFASAVQWSDITKVSQVDNYFYVYDPTTGAYEWYDGSDNSSSIPELANGVIALGQGFWTYDWGQLIFNQSCKVDGGEFVKSQLANANFLNLRLSENASTYSSTISLQESLSSTDALDTVLDIRHLHTEMVKAPSLAMYSDEDLVRKNYIKDDLRNKSFDLYTHILNAGYHTIEALNLENFTNYRKVLLYDHLTGQFIDLKQEYAYTFYSDAFEGHRFTLILTNEEMAEGSTIQSLTTNETVLADQSVTITQMGHSFNIELSEDFTEDSQITLVNVLGQTEVYSENIRLVGGSNLISVPAELKGVHILIITTGDQIITKKVVL